MRVLPTITLLLLSTIVCRSTLAQPLGEPDRGQPGDRMIQAYLAQQTELLHGRFLHGVETKEDWEKARRRYKQEFFYSLGLWPSPKKNPLQATKTGEIRGDGFVVEMLHYQSRPRLYVTANLYRPAVAAKGKRLPAVLYVCGHSGRGRNGNKTAFQSHGIWFARHGYVCLVVDTLQLGEIAAIHHGTYRQDRWWWHSRGYTPAGVECWNGVRGIDYLISRDDVDPQRIAVTGISGGGAATFWVAAADERVKVAVPVSGMADLPSYVTHRVINGHCDCMFCYNTFRGPWTRIAALIAPRPMLFVNSDHDGIFPMDANRRVINRLERLYSLYGAGDRVDSVVSVGGHAYRQDIRQAAYRFINTHLKGDPREVTDSEVDLVTRDGNQIRHPIPPEKLRAFASDSDIPADQLNTTIDRYFVPMAKVKLPTSGRFDAWKKKLVGELRRVSFAALPERVPPARRVETDRPVDLMLETEPGIRLSVTLPPEKVMDAARRIVLLVASDEGDLSGEKPLAGLTRKGDLVYRLAPRGIAASRWTSKNPPNYVRRSHVLLGTTVEAGRVRDIIATARYLRRQRDRKLPICVAGAGSAAALAAYAALLEADIDEVSLRDVPASHMDAGAPQLLNVLRVCDLGEVLGMLAPKPLRLSGAKDAMAAKVRAIYQAADTKKRLSIDGPSPTLRSPKESR